MFGEFGVGEKGEGEGEVYRVLGEIAGGFSRLRSDLEGAVSN